MTQAVLRSLVARVSRPIRHAAFLAVLLATFTPVVVAGRQVGPNINISSGTDPMTGDPFLRQQAHPGDFR